MSSFDAPDLPIALALRVDDVCRRFEARWRATQDGGDRPKLAEFLDEVEAPARAALIRELLQIDVHYRKRAGDSPRVGDYGEFSSDEQPHWLATLVGPASSAPEVNPMGAGPASREASWSALDEGFPDVPGYELLGVVGRGGMGVVYRARHLKLNRIVALKMILAGSLTRPRELDRFRREAEAVAQLQHPNIVQIHEIGEHAGHPYFALEFLNGGNLHQWISGVPRPPLVSAKLVETLARAMNHAHRRGIIHRDLKPANVFLHGAVPRDPAVGTWPSYRPEPAPELLEVEPKVGDFGLAKLLDSDAAGPTRTTDVLGTPSYMAPEQAEHTHGTVGPATDVYGLGTILYELLTGRPPFLTESVLQTLYLVRTAEPIPPCRLQPSCPRDLETICLKCLRKDQSRRYPSALALAEDLERFREGKPIRARRVGVVEQARKWVRRNRAVAGLLGLIVVLTVFSFAAVTGYAIRAEKRRADAARAEATVSASLYFQRVNRAYLEWQNANQQQAEYQLHHSEQHELSGWEWDYVRGLCEADLLTLGEHGDHVPCVVYSPRGEWLVTATGTWRGTRPGELRLWDATTGALVRKFGGEVAPILGLAFHPDGRRVASASVRFSSHSPEPGGVRIWDITTGKEVGPLSGDNPSAFSVAFSPDGRWMAAGGSDGRVRLWDAETGTAVRELSAHQKDSGVHGLAFSPDGRTVASGAWDGTLRFWDLEAQKEVRVLSGIGDIRDVAYSPGGRWIAACSYGSTVAVWDAASGERLATHAVHNAAATSVAFCPDGRSLASADISGKVHVYDAIAPGIRNTLRGHTGAVLGLAFHPDGTRLASASDDGTVKVHDPWRNQESRSLVTPRASPSTGLAYSPDGKSLASVGDRKATSLIANEEVRLWNVEAQTLRRRLKGHKQGVTDVAYSPDGRRIATSSLDGTIRFWDAATGRSLGEPLQGHAQAVNRVAFAHAGRWIISAGADGTVRVWNAENGKPLGRMAGHEGPVNGLAVSPTSRLVASAGNDRTVRLWDPESFKPVAVLSGHEAAVLAVAFSPDGRWLASAGDDRSVVLWDIPERKKVFGRLNHSRAVTALAFSPDGRRLASGSRDWSVRLWDIPSGAEAFTLRCDAGEVWSVAFRPDGEQLAGGGKEGGVIKVWEIAVPRQVRTAQAAASALAWHRKSAADCERLLLWPAAAFHIDQLIEDRPNDRALYSRRARALAESGQWDRAEADYARAGDDPLLLYYRGALRLRAGDRDGYRALCRKALDQFGQTTSAKLANSLAWTSVLIPDSEVDPDRAVALAAAATAVPGPGPNELNTMGAALYRAGRFTEAVQALEKSLFFRGGVGRIEDWYLLAMSHERLGNHAEALRWHEKAVDFLRRVDTKDATGPAPEWHERISWRLLDEEAAELTRRGP